MFSLHWNAVSLALAGLAALACGWGLSYLLHLRYDRQFGWSFVLSGIVTFSLPSASLIGIPVYLILESGLSLAERLLMLVLLGLCCVWSGLRLKRRLLSRVFRRKQADASPFQETSGLGSDGQISTLR